jgi:hypothetical protein
MDGKESSVWNENTALGKGRVQRFKVGWLTRLSRERSTLGLLNTERATTCHTSSQKIRMTALRIGKEVDRTFKAGTKMMVWHLLETLFASFHKGNAAKGNRLLFIING